MTLPQEFHTGWIQISIAFPFHRAQQKQKKRTFSVSPIQSLGSKFDFRPRSTKVTMYIKFSYYLESQMLHIKFQDNQPSGSGEDF